MWWIRLVGALHHFTYNRSPNFFSSTVNAESSTILMNELRDILPLNVSSLLIRSGSNDTDVFILTSFPITILFTSTLYIKQVSYIPNCYD